MHPQPESIFGTVFAGWLRFGGIFRWSLSAKKRSSTLLVKKCTPRQNPGYAYVRSNVQSQKQCVRNFAIDRGPMAAGAPPVVQPAQWLIHGPVSDVGASVLYEI